MKGKQMFNTVGEIKILVVEDSDMHLADFRQMFDAEAPKFPFSIKAVYATDLQTALSLVDQVDGVLSDVFYPAASGGSADVPSGQRLAEHCLGRGLPVVLCTSTYHHCRATQPVHDWAMSRSFRLFDNTPLDYRNNDVTADEKPWKVAFMGLMIFIIGQREGVSGIGIKNGKVTGDYESPAFNIVKQAPPLSEIAEIFVHRFGFPRDPELDKLPLRPTGPISV